MRRPSRFTLFPYTTLFRSELGRLGSDLRVEREDDVDGAFDRLFEVLARSEEHTSELQSPYDLVCRLLLEKKKRRTQRWRGLEILLKELSYERRVEVPCKHY